MTVPVGVSLGHDYSGAPATCTTPQICARTGCEAVLEEALGHTEVIDAAVGRADVHRTRPDGGQALLRVR